MRWPRGKAQFSLAPDNLVEGHLLVEPSRIGEVKGVVTYDVKSRLSAEVDYLTSSKSASTTSSSALAEPAAPADDSAPA
jgi:hypothetical protein